MYNEGNFCISKLEDQVLWPEEKEGKSEWVQVQLLAVAMGNLGELSTSCPEHLWDASVGMEWEGADSLYDNFPTFWTVLLLEMVRLLVEIHWENDRYMKACKILSARQ